MNSTKKAPPKLSPQEGRVYRVLLQYRRVPVRALFSVATQRIIATGSNKKLHRMMQQHVGVIISRLNKKRKKFVIVPGGKDAPHTYRITRRR